MLRIFEKLQAETAERTYQLETDALKRYTFAEPYAQGKDVLDVGTGLGHGAWLLANKGANSVVGIDFSSSAIHEASRRYVRPNLKFACFDILDPAAAELGRFDVALAYEIIEHLEPETAGAFVESIKRLVKPGGCAIISTPNKLISSPDSKPTNPYHIKEYTPRELDSLLKRYFSDVGHFGIRMENKGYVEKRRAFESSIHYKIVSTFSQIRQLHELFAIVPKPIKRLISGEARLPRLTDADFGICSDRIEECDILLAVCK